MSVAHQPSPIATAEIARNCFEESRLYHADCESCFELFRRAIVERDQEAWQAIYGQYWRLVAHWVDGHPDQVEAHVNEVYGRFWRSLESVPFGERFAELGKILAFLKACARSVRIDGARLEQRRLSRVDLETAEAEIDPETGGRAVEDIVEKRELLHYIYRHCSEQERLVIRLSFEDGLRPAQIAAERPDAFADVHEVRRVKERVVLRLSNDPRLRAWRDEQVASAKVASRRLLD